MRPAKLVTCLALSVSAAPAVAASWVCVGAQSVGYERGTSGRWVPTEFADPSNMTFRIKQVGQSERFMVYFQDSDSPNFLCEGFSRRGSLGCLSNVSGPQGDTFHFNKSSLRFHVGWNQGALIESDLDQYKLQPSWIFGSCQAG